jgi:endonuclease YncB( thermonuclease family)
MGAQVKKHGYSCKLVRVVDGDTADAMIDLGFNVWVKRRIRFYGVDTWESRTRDLEEKKLGLAAKAYVKDLLENSDDGKFSIISHGTGKYGRVLGELFIKGHEQSVNELLKEEGHAYEYTGGKKKDFKDEIAKEKAAKKEDLVDKPSEEDSENGE